MAPVSFKYWNDCVEPEDLEAMWMEADVRDEWLDAGEEMGSRVHLSRNPDGHPYLTQTEMRAVAGIIVRRHFFSQIDSDMISAIAELESSRQLLAIKHDKKSDNMNLGIMKISRKTAEWLSRGLEHRYYQVSDDPKFLHKPFVNIYFGAAYLMWLSNFDGVKRSEEFMVRAYRDGTKRASHKSTLPYWKKYLIVKGSFPSRKASGVVSSAYGTSAGTANTTWDSRTSPHDMQAMWNTPEVNEEWTKRGEKRGKVRFSHDADKNPYLCRVELRAVAKIIVAKYFLTKELKPTCLCAISEMVSMRFVNGTGHCTGLMGIDYPTACWLYRDMDYKNYKVESVEDLSKPFVSMYFGAAYMCWLSEYEGRKRTPQFIVQTYLAGPQNVNLQNTGPHWAKFEEILYHYQPRIYSSRSGSSHSCGSCTIM